jgi:hypothetical protein
MQFHRLPRKARGEVASNNVESSTTMTRTMSKTGTGNFFEDFRIGQVIQHATPRTITVGDVALYNGLFGPPRRSAIRAHRSTIAWSSTSCSARPCPTSRSTRWPISAMPPAGS